MSGKVISFILVSIQFLCIGVLFLLAYKLIFLSLATLFIITGLLLAWWAVWEMRKSKLRITPEVAKKAKLVTSGPYRYIRHPMYTSVLLFCFGLVATNFHIDNVVVYCVLVIDLLCKLFYEETLLVKHFPQYKSYKKKSKRLIPFLF